ncbi:MAG: hypothetical protein QXV73_04285 [Candidatus Micrarchaeia archaeon]
MDKVIVHNKNFEDQKIVYSDKDVEIIASLAEIIEELAEKYEISIKEAYELAEETISFALSESLGYDVQVYFKPQCKIVIYTDFGFREILPSQINKKHFKQLKEIVSQRFYIFQAYRIYEDAKKLVRTVVFGPIFRIIQNTLYVKIKNPHTTIHAGRNLIGQCPLEHQTPKERGYYREGQILPFYVTSVKGIVENNVPRIIVTLSRNSISFPEELLRMSLAERGIFTKIKAVRRIAGGWTEIHAESKIPKECIKEVGNLLKEGIIVKF